MDTGTFKLYDYQAGAQDKSASRFLQHYITRQLGVLPTGTGKTVVFSTLSLEPQIRAWLETFPIDQRKILVIAHREELVNQAKDKFERYNPGLVVQIERAGQWADPNVADVVVASIQTLASRSGRRLQRFNKSQVRLVVVDEAHHASANSYMSVWQYFGFLPPDTYTSRGNDRMTRDQALQFQREGLQHWDEATRATYPTPHRLLLGVTATPIRSDRVGLEAVFQEIVFEETLPDMIARGYLSRLQARRIHSPVSLDNISTKRDEYGENDFNPNELFKAINTVERNRVIVKAWMDHAKGLRTVVFAGNVEYAHTLADEFCKAGFKFSAIDGETKNRKELLDQLHTGELDGLVNCNVLTEGWDEDTIQCVVLARPTKSSGLYMQMVGRGTRLSPGKLFCLLLDIVDLTSRHSLMEASTLFGLPAGYDAMGGDLLDDVTTIKRMKQENPLLDVTSARSLDELSSRSSEVDLFGAFDAPEIVHNCHLSWMKSGEGEYEISYNGPMLLEETVKVKQNEFGSYDIKAESAGSREYRVAPPQEDLGAAFTAAEQLIKSRAGLDLANLKRDANWRKQGISAVQAQHIAGLETALHTPHHIDVSTLKRGRASDLIALFTSMLRKLRT